MKRWFLLIHLEKMRIFTKTIKQFSTENVKIKFNDEVSFLKEIYMKEDRLTMQRSYGRIK
jgi:hypothetical protein